MAKQPIKYKNIAKLNQRLSELQQLTDQCLNNAQYDKALNYALEAHKMVPHTVVPLDRAGVICLRAKKYEEAIKYAKKALNRDPEYINSLDILSEAYYALGDYEKCREAGLKALTLTEKQVDTNNPTLPVINIKRRTKRKNILSFSLYGNDTLYLESAVLNSELVHSLYPSWVCRFYVDDSVPSSVLERLSQNKAEIIMMDPDSTMPKTMWRFLAADDPKVNYILFRDADSVISRQEAKLVEEWVNSGQRFHTIRDYGSHTELILAGLWGMAAGSIPDMSEKIEQFVQQGNLHSRFADQHFLRKVIWPYVRQDLYASDSLFGFGDNVHWFENNVKGIFHIGCREAIAPFSATNEGWKEEEWIEWVLYSRISAEIDENLTPISIGEEREICRYRQQVKNGEITAYLPQRYLQGLKNSTSRIELKRVAK